MDNQKLPMRLGVGVILNKDNKVFVGRRIDNPNDKWQMPQGGVDEGEDYLSAMKGSFVKKQVLKVLRLLKK